MTLKFASHKVVLNNTADQLRQTLNGPTLFCTAQERQLIAQNCLQQIKLCNGLNDNLLRKCKHTFDFRKSKTENATLEQNNASILNLAIKANQQKIDSITANNKLDYFHQQDNLAHLQEEVSLLKNIQTTAHQQILGFIGEAADAIGQIKSSKDSSFGEHSFMVTRNLKKNSLELIPLNTKRATQNITPSPNGTFTNSLTSFKSLTIHHSDMQALQQHFNESRQSSSYFSRLKEILFGKQETVKTGAEAGGAACCTITSLDELANIGQRTDHDHGEIITPANGGEGALTGFVTYASVAGIKIAGDIFSSHNKMCKDIDKALDDLKLTKLENQHLLKLPSFQEKVESLDACHVFLLKQKREAQFQKRVAGILSGVCSLTILLGQFIAKLSPIGLYLLSAFGGLHFAHVGKELYKACKDYRQAAGDSIEQHHFYKKIKNLSLALLGWGLYTAGTATLGTMSLGMMGAAIHSGAAPGIIIGGIVMLGLGIVGTLVFNNIITSKRFFPGLPMMSRLNVKKPPTRKEVQDKLEHASQLRDISKQYRSNTFKALSIQSISKNKALRYCNKTLMYITLGLYPKPFMNNKFKIKANLTRTINHADQTQTLNRLTALSALHTAEKVTNPTLKKDGYNTFEIEEFNKAKASLEQQTNLSSKERLQAWIDLLENTPKSDQMMKIFARKALVEHKQLHKKTKDEAGLLGRFIPQINRTTELKPEVAKLFSNGQALAEKLHEYETTPGTPFKVSSKQPVDEEMAGTIGRLFKTAPCCNANDDANNPVTGILNLFREQFIEADKSDDDRQQLEQLLLESADQYLLYQARNNAKEDIALHANYLKCFAAESKPLYEDRQALQLQAVT
ncbi:MAG TPA: hypothetical protein DDW29_09195 [Gammaproteobacteria bacterium]|nr:hypothetical protein [Gammaproteobacteria bacterium]|tara:strand:+ start:1664 stop:4219 length:2556 start_codon:yes stop_codon:yes gene_type:complete